MKKFTYSVSAIVLFLVSLHMNAGHVSAACNWTLGSGAITAVTCGVDGQATEAYDYSAGADDATNGTTLTVPAGVTVTLNGGAAGVPTTLLIGSISTPETVGQEGTGIIVASQSNVTIKANTKCYVLDADGDTYTVNANLCSETGGAGYIRKNKLTSTTPDCADNNSSANPGQTAYLPGTFTNVLNAANDNDWNCDGAETKAYTRLYTCTACTNASGYGSFQAGVSGTTNQDPANTGWLTTIPECNTSATRYTVTNLTCRDPLVANCSTSVTTAALTQTCL